MGARVSLHVPTFDRVDQLQIHGGDAPTPRARPRHYRVISYVVNSSGTILSNLTPRQWVLSAQESGAQKLANTQIEGRSLYSFFNGGLLKAFYRNLIRIVHMRQRESFSFLFFCDSSSLRREMVLCTKLTFDGNIEFSSFTISQSPHVAPFLDAVVLTSRNDGVEACPFCNRFRVNEHWIRPCEYQRTLTSWQPGQAVPVGSKVCMQCATVILEPLSPFPRSVSSDEQSPPSAHPFVLFVDDNEYTLSVYEALARACLWVPHSIRDPSTVSQYVRHNPVDVIIVDMVMPSMSGVELLRSLSELGLLRFPAIGASTSLADKQYLFAAGCVEFLQLPLTRSSLRRAVAVALKGKYLDPGDDLPGSTVFRAV
eukprot:TRINITY_DN2245_c0_g1_i1.p1 TRINITY_DN2245_c0_g1~~TRINITY_DN2245_c0_g1_i1.p1  ORF type:complete len:369 (+),score=27.11 TRINITY_DN2245_c0_g1_i1:25-1131(+)